MTTQEQLTWGTAKTHGLTAGDVIQWAGSDRKTPREPMEVTVTSLGRSGVYFDGRWYGGIATRFWVKS